MASACINNIGVSPEIFLDCPTSFHSYGWLSPRISFSRDEEASKSAGVKSKPPTPAKDLDDAPLEVDPEVSGKEVGDFEFRLEDPVTMLPADELFADGKLMPLHFSIVRSAVTSSGITTPDTPKPSRRIDISGMDPYLFSPKAPTCSGRWKELLGLKKLYQNNAKQDNPKTTASLNTSANSNKSLKYFLHRNSQTSPASDSSLNLPLLKESDNEFTSISSRLSLSSSSSGHDHDELPRLSLDSEKPPNPPRIRLVKARAVSSENKKGRSPMRRPADNDTGAMTTRGVSADSPRMNSSGKIVFHGLERSSSSPSSFNGGPRYKHRGMERSYSANVRVTPVLNVPVCSLGRSSKSGGLFGFPLFSAPPHKRDGGSGSGSRGQQQQQISNKNRMDRG